MINKQRLQYCSNRINKRSVLYNQPIAIKPENQSFNYLNMKK